MPEIKNILDEKKLVAILISSPENLYYLSGFSGGEGFLLLTADKKQIFVDGRYTIQAKQQTSGFIVTEFYSNPYQIIADMNFEKIGFEDNFVSYSSFLKMSELMPKVKFVGISGELLLLRSIKNEYECKCLKQAEKIGDMAFEHILKFIKPGVTERQIATEIEFFMKKNGALGTSFSTIVAAGDRSALPHADLTDKKVESGNVVLMDFGCVYKGYCSDMTRTVAVGNISDKIKNIYDIVLNAQKAALGKIKAGINSKDVDKTARDIISDAGFGGNFNHALGHGVGLEIHELPNLSYKSNAILKEGNIVTVEPGIYIENFCGIRIEDMVLVTENGYENFTQSSKDFIIL